ncbi:LPS export ABC transporter periplasmic protein LptC [Inhella gelatinilytica]|uniref:LPS export ABC transporter periplasmic protein LptC n=1 Tax=Inhella gelatinilytica TaxID=2795030 RepID=A0A931IWU3_9BURK|nr:LPS export ABC transporter periplasmic protein LptC [Inhella gelatinilytica]MBH9553614.1 LPS export ABC transporter periplasmic protein LptC [Inhella gelatinilytica]
MNAARPQGTGSGAPLAPLPPLAGRSKPPRGLWVWRLQAWLSHYLPLALLALGALFTAWLARQTPPVGAPTVERAVRTDPDYTMSGFEIHRFWPDGRQQAWLSGETLRHFPHNDTIEVDQLRLRWVDEAGRVMVALAQRGSGPAKGERLRLDGAVQVQRFAADAPEGAAAEWVLNTESLEAWGPEQRLFSRRPTQFQTESLQLQATGFEYQHRTGHVMFQGPNRTELQPRRTR